MPAAVRQQQHSTLSAGRLPVMRRRFPTGPASVDDSGEAVKVGETASVLLVPGVVVGVCEYGSSGTGSLESAPDMLALTEPAGLSPRAGVRISSWYVMGHKSSSSNKGLSHSLSRLVRWPAPAGGTAIVSVVEDAMTITNLPVARLCEKQRQMDVCFGLDPTIAADDYYMLICTYMFCFCWFGGDRLSYIPYIRFSGVMLCQFRLRKGREVFNTLFWLGGDRLSLEVR